MSESTEPGGAPLGDEARRLLGAIQDWAQRTMPAPPSGHPGPECQWCPLCQFASILRGERPELTERLAEAGAAVGTALRAVLEGVADPARPRPSRPSSGLDDANVGEPPASRVQHIRLDDRPDDHSDDPNDR